MTILQKKPKWIYDIDEAPSGKISSKLMALYLEQFKSLNQNVIGFFKKGGVETLDDERQASKQGGGDPILFGYAKGIKTQNFFIPRPTSENEKI